MSIISKIIKEAYDLNNNFIIYDKNNQEVFKGDWDKCAYWWGKLLYNTGPNLYELQEYKTERGQYWLALISHRGPKLKVIKKGNHSTIFNYWFDMLVKSKNGLNGYTASII